jgi:heat shock protein HslJ
MFAYCPLPIEKLPIENKNEKRPKQQTIIQHFKINTKMKGTFITFLAVLSLAACKKETIKGDLNSTWTVEKLNGAKVNQHHATCTLDIERGISNGTSGCNSFGSDVRVDEKLQTITFHAIVRTEKGCKDDLGFFEALQNVNAYKFEDLSTLHLIYNDGKVIELKK